MTCLKIHLSDDLRVQAEARAAEAGYGDVEEYVASLVRADTAPYQAAAGVPANLSFQTDQELLNLLRAGQTSPAREFDPAEWERKKQKYSAKT